MSTTHPTASAHLLEGLNDLGIQYLFCNLGTDHAPLIEEMARWQEQGKPLPEVVLCPHENTAMHMAAGYAIATGRGQGVLVHVDAGTANAAMAMHNLYRARIPVLLMAGKAPFTTYGELPGGRQSYVHFVQEPYDQGSVVRPYVKWEYSLPVPHMTREVLARAVTVMQSDPMGPSYLMLPREVLAAEAPPVAEAHRRSLESRPVRAGGVPEASLTEVVQRLLAAKEPLLITGYAGRNPAVPPLIEELAELVGMRVAEFNAIFQNVSRDSPCYAGSQPGPLAERCDFGLLVDVDVPWMPSAFQANPEAFWVQVDVDALKSNMPMWSFPTDVRLQGDAAAILAQLIALVREQLTSEHQHVAQQRVTSFRQEADARHEALQAVAQEPGESGAIRTPWVCAALQRALRAEDIVVNETITQSTVVADHIPRTVPGTMVGSLAGGLGFSGGVALGLKLALPERQVVQVVGDGSFYFCNPASMHAVSRQYGLPILTVVLDNGGWAAVKASTLRMYPKGVAYNTDEFASRLTPDVDFARMAEAAGAYGELVTEPGEVEAAIERAMAAVRGGQSAVLHVRVAKL